MKPTLLALMIVSVLALVGCSVLDEIDAAGDKMDKLSRNPAKQPEAAEAAPSPQTTRNELLEQSKKWWNEATSLAPKEVDSSIVTCRLREGTQFMSKDDCLIRGGVPKNVAG